MAGSFAVTTLVMKNSLMDNLATDYVRTAIAKGMSFRRAVFRHAFRNSLVPIATSFGGNISLILAGSFLIERSSTSTALASWASSRWSCATTPS